ncbi:phosphate acyltransferase PlsX [Clostridium intestinale]|uniref:phosphate acyltransferase PlsX n=1 Tax=Clostridium intestinale TaxID=36845 RepID=UPI002DD6990D|nr:phosphate acyltransferase PlsX [Clostridium intestinale]WRY53057.1 phosphate acyltransferase PlsX [Clostridium intestinale]
MKFVVDGMGGDDAPKAVVEGVVEALNEFKDIEQIYITGPEEKIKEVLSNYTYDENRLKIVDCTEVITPDEHPVMALRKKKNSSLVKALNLVKSGECDGIISAGSTGAFLAGCTLIVGRIKGIERPVLAPIMPGKNGRFMVVDAGANVDSKPHYLPQFALMGEIYYKNVMGVTNPSVGLVNIGTEEGKGNELTKAAYPLLKDMPINFIGNVEPREASKGDVNVLVCDGFVGNTLLKTYEGVASTLLGIIKDEINSSLLSKIGAVFLIPVFKTIKKRFDYKEEGGAPFLGVDGVCIKAHGSSDGRAFKNAIRQGKIFCENDILNKIKLEIQK